MANDKMHKRGLTSFFTLYGFLVMSITGLILYIVPQGRIAYWVNWEFTGLTKTDWGNIHIISSILFIVAGAFHIYFNWTILLNYFKKKAANGLKLKRELALSSAVSILIVIGALFSIPPISYLLDLNEYIKDAWIVSEEYEPPFGHAEELSLKVFCEKMEIDLEKATTELKSKGIEFENTAQSLTEISILNETSPMDIYMIIKKFEPIKESIENIVYTPEMVELEFSGTGIGNKTLEGLCEKLQLDMAVAQKRINENGIEITADDKLKDIAENNNIASLDLLKMILIDGYRKSNN